jgi:coenzyme PQQ synthesis protein D (PqqD)
VTDTFIAQGLRLAAREVAGQMVILSAGDSHMFVLNEVGTAVWNAADGRTPLSSVVDRVCREYDVDRETAERDVREFVDQLVEAKILIEAANPIGDYVDVIRREEADSEL